MKLYGCLPYARLNAAFSSQNGLAKHTLGKTAKNNALEIRQSYDHSGVTTEHDPISSMIIADSYHSHREAHAPISVCPYGSLKRETHSARHYTFESLVFSLTQSAHNNNLTRLLLLSLSQLPFGGRVMIMPTQESVRRVL